MLTILDNVRYYSFQMNQLWLFSEKQRDRSRFDIDGRVDFNYGIDSSWATGLDEGWGCGDYCVSLPQMYLEVGKGDFSLSVGKMFTTMGCDSTYATERFFYGTSYECQTCADYSAVIGRWDVNEKFSVFSGWTNGESRFFTDLNHNAFIRGVNWKILPRFQVDYSISGGRNDGESKYLVSSLLGNLDLGKWDYTIIWLLRNVQSLETPGSDAVVSTQV